MSRYSNSQFTIKKNNTSPNVVLRVVVIIVCVLILWLLFSLVLKKIRTNIPVGYMRDMKYQVSSKQTLFNKTIELENILAAKEAQILESEVLRLENEALKKELGRVYEKGILAHVQTLPHRSFYDSIRIDAGAEQGVVTGMTAYAFGNIALGTISYTDAKYSIIELFSGQGKEQVGTIAGTDVAVTMIGRSAGEYEVRMPRDIKFETGTLISHQQTQTSILARIERVASDPRDPFQKLYAKVPINLQAMKWVIVR